MKTLYESILDDEDILVGDLKKYCSQIEQYYDTDSKKSWLSI